MPFGYDFQREKDSEQLDKGDIVHLGFINENWINHSYRLQPELLA